MLGHAGPGTRGARARNVAMSPTWISPPLEVLERTVIDTRNRLLGAACTEDIHDPSSHYQRSPILRQATASTKQTPLQQIQAKVRLAAPLNSATRWTIAIMSGVVVSSTIPLQRETDLRIVSLHDKYNCCGVMILKKYCYRCSMYRYIRTRGQNPQGWRPSLTYVEQ